MTIYDELKARGLIAQVTDEEEIKEVINNGKATFYIGFDCTADSLTAGHFMALTLMKRLQQAGNRPIALIGGGTTMIGDPSGRTDMRKMLTKEDIDHNAECFKRQMERFIEFGEGKALMLNNADWLLDLNYIELLREVGPCFSVNNMLRAECYKQRMEKGLSFLEFNYMIMQSYDFYHLFQNYGCNMEFGGDDQWSNMLGGTELIRRKLGKDAYAMTITLLTDSQGKKMGKTAGNAVWLDPNKTSPFEFYQYWRNVGDADVLKCIRMLTFLPLEQIDEMDHWEGEQLNKAKEILAEQGIDLEVVEFSDYVQPNLVTESGEVDANYFQHTPYLDSFNEENGTHLVSVGAVHYEPFGIYPGKSDDLANIADGATIAVPNDTTNEARALQLLAAQGLITVRDGAGLTATVNDITDNPHNLQIKEIEAAQLPRTVQDVDFAVINGNYAMEAGFSVGKDALATEDASSEAAQTYANVLVVKEGRENDPAIQALYAALTGDKVKDYINSTYDGAVVPIF